MSPEVLDACDGFAKGVLNRQEFLSKVTRLAGCAAACALLPLLEDRDASAEDIAREVRNLHAQDIEYAGETGPVRAHLARLKGHAKRPGVIVIHENKGLQPHIKDVARRMAGEGFLAIAPDALSPLGGTPENVDEARSLIGKLDDDATLKNFIAAIEYLKTHRSFAGKVGCIGFCWGGRMANQMAVHAADLDAAVPFYGSQPEPEDVPKIKASLLLHYAGLDERINKGIPAFEAALKAAGADYSLHMYEGAQHAFHNDTNTERYHPQAAQLAWQRTIAFLKEKLRC